MRLERKSLLYLSSVYSQKCGIDPDLPHDSDVDNNNQYRM